MYIAYYNLKTGICFKSLKLQNKTPYKSCIPLNTDHYFAIIPCELKYRICPSYTTELKTT